jgi:thiol-disulfide isomerase/thioredoxin
MTPLKKWLAVVGLSLAVVLGYAAFLLLTRGRVSAARVMAENSVPELRDVVGKPLPECRLSGVGDRPLAPEELRKGKVVLVLLTTGCEACRADVGALKELVERRKDIRFVGVMSFEQSDELLRLAESKFPFKVFRDERMELAQALNLARVPVKIYLEDGVVKQSWDGAVDDERERHVFAQWPADTH